MKNILYKILYCIGVVAQLITGVSCNKYLEERPTKTSVVITKLSDLQAMLDNLGINSNYYALATGGADEYYFPESAWAGKAKDIQDAYVWAKETNIDAWSLPYKVVFQSNVVLSEVEKLPGSDSEKDYIRGQAYYHRAFAFFQIAQLYCAAYDAKALNSLGIVLRIDPSLEKKYSRSTVNETYKQIIEDFEQAERLLSDQLISNNRPNKISTFGALSRVYLSMREYQKSLDYSNKYLAKRNELIDYNTLDTMANPPIGQMNVETAYYAYMVVAFPGEDGIADSTLINSYESADLRRGVFFYDQGDGRKVFKGSYAGFYGNYTFCGIATNEIYMNRAECLARLNDLSAALNDINFLLEKRFKAGSYTPFMSANKEVTLDFILNERRKELVNRGTRWMDLRRLNLEGRNIILRRMINGKVFELPANDPRYVWLIPSEVIRLSGVIQNPR